MIQRTMVGYDGSASAKQALRFGLDMMRLTGGHVYVVFVVQPTAMGPADSALSAGAQDEHDHGLLDEIAKLAGEDGDIVTVDSICGSPGDALLGYAEKHAIEHIVLGHTERGSLLQWLLGSVSEHILNQAYVPVTVIR